MNGIDLLDEFRGRRSEPAFSELVRRYTNLVYAAAKRRLASQSLAQDAAQAVFIRLARNPPQLSNDTELSGWLHRTTVHVSIDLWRAEVRRRAREEHAAAMQLEPNPNPSSAQIAPALDEALNDLTEPDRQVILLRFFDHKSMRELGGVFGISEDAAKMRVSRALDRLRDQLSARGVTCTVLALGAFLAERSVEAAPEEVAAAVAAFQYPIAYAAISAAGGATGFLGRGALAKVAGGIAAVTLVGVSVWLAAHRRETPPRIAAGSASNAPSRIAGASKSSPPGASNPALAVPDATEPNPARLLQAVLRARQRIESGSIEFQVETLPSAAGRTNRSRIAAVFDGTKRRFESFAREYSYTYDPDPKRAEEIEAKAQAYGPDAEGAVQAGLLRGFEAHRVTTYDGAALVQYSEEDGKPGSATVDDPAKGSSAFVFDPRCLGLATSFSPQLTLEQCLNPGSAEPAQLMGKETVEGVPVWHVRQLVSGRPRDFWLDAAQPVRVLKVQAGSSVVISRYDSSQPRNPLPKEVIKTAYRNGAPDFETHIVQTASQFNVVLDPATFSLAGLAMKPGTAVSDIRAHRRLGYWTGADLSQDPPRQTAKAPQDQPKLEDMLAVLDFDTTSASALDAATWILLNTPDGPEVDKAAAVILQYHARSPELAPLCQRMERMRHRCAGEFLTTILKENPHPDVKAAACFALATLRKDESKYGEDKKTAAEAEQLFQRSIKEFSPAGPDAASLAAQATAQLDELRRMSIGKPAPDFEAADLNGQTVRLSQQRGKVAVVVFWLASTLGAPEENLMLFGSFQERPFVCIAVNCDNDLNRVMPVIKKYPLPWPVILDGGSGPVAGKWDVQHWPAVYVLDRQGVIRAREPRGPALVDTVAKLLAE
jgi:RNA polymerase sigma factor (sigma-70 family)